jgi:hypothetical protein
MDPFTIATSVVSLLDIEALPGTSARLMPLW